MKHIALEYRLEQRMKKRRRIEAILSFVSLLVLVSVKMLCTVRIYRRTSADRRVVIL